MTKWEKVSNSFCERELLSTLLNLADRGEWCSSLEKNDIPAFSEANILSTFEQLHQSKGEVFERGVINVFKGLSWNYRTNSPYKFGAKIIVSGLVKYARWGFGLNWRWQRDRLADLERMLMFLDGKPIPDNRADVIRIGSIAMVRVPLDALEPVEENDE